jgi:endonuclease V-like protein UPF0215 family
VLASEYDGGATKSGVRIAAIATGPIGKGRGRRSGKKALLVCVIGTMNGVEGVLSTSVTIDGSDATGRIIGMVKRSRFREQVRVLAFNGIALAGLNILNVRKLRSELGASVLVVTRHKPRPSLLMKALKALRDGTGADAKERDAMLKSQKWSSAMNGFYVQSYIGTAETKRILKTAVSLLRLSHLIASGVSRGESKGRI